MSLTPYYEQDGIVIYHGDCRVILPELAADVLITDPPYGIGLESHKGSGWAVEGDADGTPGCLVLAWWGARPRIVFASPMRPWPGVWQQFLVWDKGAAVGGGGDPLRYWKRTWELLQIADVGPLHGKRDGAVLRYCMTPRDAAEHPCAKPVALLSYLVSKTTTETDVILDPFMGTGATLRAAKNLGRRAIGIELKERYCAIAVQRLAQQVLPLEVR